MLGFSVNCISARFQREYNIGKTGMNIIKQMVPIRYGAAMNSASSLRLYHTTAPKVISQEQQVIIALGSNVGNRLQNFQDALHRMKKSGIRVTRHACLYETEPAYVTDQPRFLNSAVRALTKLNPNNLLRALKEIEKDLGRTTGIRYGPRPIDLDILFYGKQIVNTETLKIPHERIWERPFVLGPLVDLFGLDEDNDMRIFEGWEKLGGESLIGREGMKRVFPIGDRLWDWSEKTSVMGILNITPDSFSDGGKFLDTESAITQAQSMLMDGADIIDIGAQSTRPMASKISPEQELDRLIPVLEAIKKLPEMEGKFISVDTFYSKVASEAVKNGAHIVNDVSAGSLDPKMHEVIAGLKIPYVVMHMRGDPMTMMDRENLVYGNVCADVAAELYGKVREAEGLGVEAWRMIVDPGIGFSKGTGDNLDVVNGLGEIRAEMGRRSVGVSRGPVMIGVSRKRFLGEICGREKAGERDAGTVGCVVAGVLGGANIVRVHNVRDCVDAVRVCDALMRRRRRVCG